MDTATKPGAFKYYIVASLPPGDDDLAKALFNHLMCIPVFSDHCPKVTTFGAVRGDCGEYSSPFRKDDEIVLVIDGYARNYTNTIQTMHNEMHDFRAGWNAFKALANRKEEAAANLAAEKARIKAEKARIKAEKKQLKVGDHVMIKDHPGAEYVITSVGTDEVRINHPNGGGGWYPTSELKKVKAPK